MIGSTEIIIIAAVVLLLFGGAALPKFFRSLGRAKKEFEKGALETDSELDQMKEEKQKENKSDK